MSDLTGWGGEERRRNDPKLEAAMTEVRHLYGAVEELAVAVSKSVPRDEIEAREREQVERQHQFREQAKLIVIGLAIVFVLLVTYSILTVRGLNRHMDDGHEVLHNDNQVLLCVVRLPEASRNDAAVLSCRQATQVKGVP